MLVQVVANSSTAGSSLLLQSLPKASSGLGRGHGTQVGPCQFPNGRNSTAITASLGPLQNHHTFISLGGKHNPFPLCTPCHSCPFGVWFPSPEDEQEALRGQHLSSSVRSQHQAPEAPLSDEIISRCEDPCS